MLFFFCCCFFLQAEGGIRDLVRSRGLGDVYKRQGYKGVGRHSAGRPQDRRCTGRAALYDQLCRTAWCCLLYTSDAADERSSVDLGGRRIIKNKTEVVHPTVC